jgi:uncharacterized membrane-anchored protein YitT (DUF2179 family)
VPTATPAAVGSGPVRIMKISLAGGSAASKVELKNAATDTGDVLFTLNAITTEQATVSFEDVGGLAFSVGCFAKPAGTAAIAYIWFEPMQSQVAFA